MPDSQNVNPQDDPEFWDRPADPPPAHDTGDFYRIYENFEIMYRGDLAILKKSRTLYHYTEDGWVKGPGLEETND